jgi:hypothetical protein
VAKEQVHEIVFDEALVTDTNLNFAFGRLEAQGNAAGGYFALVQIFVQQPAELVVNLEHDSHDPSVESMECLLITGLNPGTDFDRHSAAYCGA